MTDTQAQKPIRGKIPLMARVFGIILMFMILAVVFGPPVLAIAKLVGVTVGLSYLLIFTPWGFALLYLLGWNMVFQASLAANRVAIQELVMMAAQSSLQANAMAAKIVSGQALKNAAAALHANQKVN